MSLRERPIEEPTPLPASASEQVQIVEQALRSDFGAILPPEVIARVADEAVARFAQVPVQTFVPILAIRDARRHGRSIAYGAGDRRSPNAATASVTVSKMNPPPTASDTP